MNENIRKFLELASSNEEFKNKLNSATKESIIALAREQGIELTDADFGPTSEVSDDELNTVAGGNACACVLGGGGTGSAGQKTCACVGVGFGKTAGGKSRCGCAAAGSGEDITD